MNKTIETLIEEIEEVQTLISKAEENARKEAELLGINVMDLRTTDGKWIMNELLSARVQAMHSLIVLEILRKEQC